MSHLVTMESEIKDLVALKAACKRLGLEAPVAVKQGDRMASSMKGAIGMAVKLPGWTYPVVCDLGSGQLRYDNYNEKWGKTTELNKLKQACAVEKGILEARRKRYSVQETALENGSIKLAIRVGS